MLTLLFVLLMRIVISADHISERQKFIHEEDSQRVGSSIVLNDQEDNVNKYLMYMKLIEYDLGFAKPATFNPARHFFEAQPDIKKSDVFKFIQRLPKGASLHIHDLAMASFKSLYNLTYRENLYACTANNRLRLHFFKEPLTDRTCNWTLIEILRKENATYDEWVKSQLTLTVPKPAEVYTDINVVWKSFTSIFDTLVEFITYKPVFQDYFYSALKEHYFDNVMYVEFRTTLSEVYDIDGNVYSPIQVACILKGTLNAFMHDYPNFQGARFIYAPSRQANTTTITDYIQTAKKLSIAYPDFMTGFDLVGQEDLGVHLVDLIDSINALPRGIKRFFHAGETNWNGASTDLNLVDALIFGTSRIGHGYAITKHPKVMEVIKDRGIAIEVCPISNQILLLVEDLRNHPANTLISQGFPVVICNDDPGFWGAEGLSYDWYLAFMGMTARNADLRFLKQLAINSIIYSSLPDDKKSKVLEKWNIEWNNFISAALKYVTIL